MLWRVNDVVAITRVAAKLQSCFAEGAAAKLANAKTSHLALAKSLPLDLTSFLQPASIPQPPPGREISLAQW